MSLQRRLTEEYERCQHYLDTSTRKPLISAVEHQLLERHVAALLEKGFDVLMAEQRVPDLARLYNLCGRIHALDALKAAFKAYIKKAGLALVMDEEKVRAHGPGSLGFTVARLL
jgi:cullin-4